MTASPPLAFPGSRILAGWWTHLARIRPRALWVGHLLLHRVEAPVCLQKSSPVDSLSHFILKALTLAPGNTIEELERRLQLGRPLLWQGLRSLENEKLVQAGAGPTWSLAPLGHQAATNGTYPRPTEQRLSFHFVETGQPDRPLHFLKLSIPATLPCWPYVDEWRF